MPLCERCFTSNVVSFASIPQRSIEDASLVGNLSVRVLPPYAAKGDIGYLESYARIVERHQQVIEGIVPGPSRLDVQSIVNPLLEELGNIYRGVSLIKDLSDRTLDIIVSYGERLSSVIISRVIEVNDR